MNADSLFEAAVLALQAFKASGWTEGIGPATQVEVEVRVTTTRHVVERGADPTVDGRGVGQSCGAAEAGSAEGYIAGGSPGVVRLGTNIRRLSSRDLPLPKFVRAGSQREHRRPALAALMVGWASLKQFVPPSCLRVARILHLQPVRARPVGVVAPACELRHNRFEVVSAGHFEEVRPALLDVVHVQQPGGH